MLLAGVTSMIGWLSPWRRTPSTKRARARSFAFEPLEQRQLLAVDLRAIDGDGNNPSHPDWGSTDAQLVRIAEAFYGDGASTPAGAARPSARAISNAVVAQNGSLPNDRMLTDFIWQWGQFLDHDLSLSEGADPAEAFPIDVPTGDPFFDPSSAGGAVIGLNRTVYDPATGLAVDNPRQQINQITAYIDASNVYGSDAARAADLRTFTGGKLRTSSGDLLPFNTNGLPNAGGTGATLFIAGDVRANEQTGLAAMHTLFVREHNRLADEIAAADGSLGDEEIYQQARRIVAAQMQVITYREFLPALLGPHAIHPYFGYDATVNAGVANEFSTALYRFGHSMLSSQLLRLDAAGNVIPQGSLNLRDAFFNPSRLTAEGGVDPILRGLAAQLAQELDARVIDDVRNFLFGPPGAGGFDLASLNIQRGRDHGLPSYNQARVAYGLSPAASFADITSDPTVAQALAGVYGDVNDVDLWLGALAEDHLPGGSVGELLRAALVEQFTRLRDGDRFWYTREFDGQQLIDIQNTTLADVIQRNTAVADLQPNVFFADGALPEGWIQNLYQDILGRHAVWDEWRYWDDALADGLAREQVVNIFLASDENRGRAINDLYLEFLGREAEPGGVKHWLGVWRSAGADQVRAGIIGSAEFFASAGGTDAAWVEAVYRHVLGRTTVAQSEIDYWTERLVTQSRRNIVLGFLRSDEHRGNLLDGWYADYLRRVSEDAGRDYWLAHMRGGMHADVLQMLILTSGEYLARA